MQLGIVLLGHNDSVNLSIWKPGRPTRFILLGRRKHLLFVGAMLVCVMGVWFTTQLSTMATNALAKSGFVPEFFPVREEVVSIKNGEVKVESAKAQGWLRKLLAMVSPQESSRSRVMPYDGLRILSRGEKVVVHFGGEAMIAEIAGAPNETVLLRRGAVPERLYVLGDASYAVMANQQSKIVRASDIVATVTAPVEVAHN